MTDLATAANDKVAHPKSVTATAVNESLGIKSMFLFCTFRSRMPQPRHGKEVKLVKAGETALGRERGVQAYQPADEGHAEKEGQHHAIERDESDIKNGPPGMDWNGEKWIAPAEQDQADSDLAHLEDLAIIKK